MHRIRPALAAVVLLGVAAFAWPADAADLDVVAGALRYDDFADVANTLTITRVGGIYTLDDPAGIVRGSGAIDAGCLPVDADTVTCPAAAVTALALVTRGGNDRVTLAGLALAATVTTGDGDDTIVGGDGDDVVVWNPGDDHDTVDGGPGGDTLVFNGSNASEQFVVGSAGEGFTVFRNVGDVHLGATAIELLRLRTFAGTDAITTTGLVATIQEIETAGDASLDTLTFDAGGLCPFVQTGLIELLDRERVQFVGISSLIPVNYACGATLDVIAGVLTYTGTQQIVRNDLTIVRDDDRYVVHDTGEIVSLAPHAAERGCAQVASDVATCPAGALVSASILTRGGDDAIDLGGFDLPAIVSGGDGDDTTVGGEAADVVVWNPGDDNDTVDGGLGSDTFQFNGSNAAESYVITALGTGFALTRDVANVRAEVDGVETLALATFGSIDRITTTILTRTTQHLTGGSDGAVDTLVVDANGLCPEQQAGSIGAAGRAPVLFTSFPDPSVVNAFCVPDACAGATPSLGCTVNGLRNQPCLGTDGNDVIVGTSGGDVIIAGDGADRIRAGDEADVVCGEGGDDVIIGGRGNDTLLGGLGADRLRGDAGDDDLIGNDGPDDLQGGRGLDELYAGLGDDRLKAGPDADMVRGDDGVDRIDGGAGDDDVCLDTDQAGPFTRCEL